MPNQPLIEPLESRRLLAGVTILSHGYNGSIDGWVDSAADDIQARAGGKDASSIYTLKVDEVSGSLAVTGFSPDSGQSDFHQTTGGELIVRLDWSNVSGGSYSTIQVGTVVSSYLLTAHGTVAPLAELPIHLIGHSRGASLNVAISKDLGTRGVWVDQNTFLDPHPVDGDMDVFGANFGDAKMRVFDNVVYSDDYWRTDGDTNNFDFDGEQVDGSLNANLNSSVQQNFFSSAHGAVPAYYIGTIDTKTTDGGDHPVLPAWYTGTADKPARDKTGYVYSRIVGAKRAASGVSVLFGGDAPRKPVDTNGPQYPNGNDLRVVSSTSLTAGEVLQTQIRVGDQDTSTRVTLFLDNDTNPYDGAVVELTGKTVAASAPTFARIDAPTSAVTQGSYYLAAKVSDASGQARYTYLRDKIDIGAANFAAVAAGVLKVDGTAGNDVITVATAGGNITARLGNASQTFAASGINRVEVYAGDGIDSVDLSALTKPAYVNAGAGNDNVYGGTANDTLTGGAGRNTLNGADGDDRLNGSGAADLLVGGNGNDRLYGNGGNDTLSGGGNVDRLFGGDGDDYLVGGNGNDKIYAGFGNDTLLGQAGSDILDGGPGTDSYDQDASDLVGDVEVVVK